jgi:TonB family protein
VKRLRALGAAAAALALAGTALAQGLTPPAAAAPAKADPWRPKLIAGSCPRPAYPLDSVRAEETGITLVQLTVGINGEVTKSSVARSSGHTRLDTAAADSLARCKFTPAHDSAGAAVPGSTVIEHVWRLSDAPPDPWLALRGLNGAGREATADLDAIPFALPTQATAEQRVKILAGLQQESAQQSGCSSIEQISATPLPAELKIDPVIDAKSGKPIRLVREVWTASQCGLTMRYMLVMRFPENEGASFGMLPLPAAKPTAR